MRDPEFRRARERALFLLDQRPEVTEEERAATPPWLSSRYFGGQKAAAWLLVVAGVSALPANRGPWYFYALAALVAGLGLAIRLHVYLEGFNRRVEAARIRRDGPDEVDTLSELQRNPAPHVLMVKELLSLVLYLALGWALYLEARLAWSGGLVLRVLAVVMLLAYVAGLVVFRFSWDRPASWKQDFLRDEGRTLPALSPELRILVRRRSS